MKVRGEGLRKFLAPLSSKAGEFMATVKVKLKKNVLYLGVLKKAGEIVRVPASIAERYAVSNIATLVGEVDRLFYDDKKIKDNEIDHKGGTRK